MRCHVAFLKFYIALSVRKAIICCALTQVDVSARTPLLTGDPSMVGSFPHHGCSTETSLSTFFVFFRAWLKSMPFLLDTPDDSRPEVPIREAGWRCGIVARQLVRDGALRNTTRFQVSNLILPVEIVIPRGCVSSSSPVHVGICGRSIGTWTWDRRIRGAARACNASSQGQKSGCT